MEMLVKLLPTIVLMLVALTCSAKTPWPEAPKAAYVKGCVQDMSSQGMPAKIATTFCSCAAEGMSKEFGLEDYTALMKAQPNPRGSSDDKRLYKVMSACSPSEAR
jgi:hypothetical protein